jgi:hypothetical protein
MAPGQDSLKLDYDVPDNPWIERRTIDEMRRIPATDWLFGKMALRVVGTRFTLLWFAMREMKSPPK